MLITIKFGGTSVGDADRIRSAAELVARVKNDGHRVVVITSAMSGVTNKLVALVDQAAGPTAPFGSRVAEYLRFTKTLEQDHVETARRAIRDPQLVENVAQALYTERHSLERVLIGSHLLAELTPIGYDFVVSEGERLCVPILANCLRDLGVSAVGVGGDECGITTDNNYGSARPNDERTRQGVRQALLPLLDSDKVPVVTGFYGRSDEGRIAVLGRGGSDYSATLVGCALDSDEVWIMTDVDGVKTTDPRLVPHAHTISEMPYLIAAEMAMLGAKVLHAKSVQPAAKHGTRLRIASSFEPEKPGTWLVPLKPGGPPSVAALTLVRRGGMVRLTSPGMGAEGNFTASLIADLQRHNVDTLASAAGLNGSSVLWLVGNLDLERFLAIAKRHESDGFQADVQRNVAVIGIVGAGVATAPGILARVTHSFNQAGARPLAVVHGASPHSVVLALDDDEQPLAATLKLLHTELGLDRRQRA